VVPPGPTSVACGLPRLGTNLKFGLVVGRTALEVIAAGLHAACDVTVAGFNATPFCIAAGVTDVLFLIIQGALDGDAVCSDELDSLASDAAIATQAGIATQLDSVETKLDANGAAAEQVAQRQVELQLKTCEPLVSLVLPQRFGGALEEVRELVTQSIERAQLAGVGDIPEATRRMQRGHQSFEVNQYQAAYRSFCLAYRALLAR
jgi:hypothetical protein